MEHLSLGQANRIDLVDYLATLGIQPKKRKAHFYYYCSPLPGHPASRPTFIVNRRLNCWRETTTRQAGRLTDLAINLYDCTIGELTARLQSALPPVSRNHSETTNISQPKIIVERTQFIRSAFLQQYLWERRISADVTRRYCLEAWYSRENKLYHSLAFPNNAGGFELFDKFHHYRVPDSAPTVIANDSQNIAVFRHVLDLLSFATIFPGPGHDYPDFLVLNAPVLFQVIRQIIEPYNTIHLFLPNDDTGIVFSSLATKSLPACQDHRQLYSGYPTLNDWLCRIGTAQSPHHFP